MTIQQTNLTEILGRPIPTIQIMDVGAAALSQDRYHQLITLGYANVTGFEPNPAEYAKLQNRKGPYRYLPVFLGNGAPGKFHFARFPGCSSLLQPNPAVIDMFMTIGCAEPGDNFHVVRTEMVDTVRLDDLDNNITIGYLKIDVQGYELEIMRNGRNKLSNASHLTRGGIRPFVSKPTTVWRPSVFHGRGRFRASQIY